MKRLLSVLSLVAFGLQALPASAETYNCRKQRVRTPQEQRSSCSLSVEWRGTSYYDHKWWSAWHTDRGEYARGENDCRDAEADAMAKCEDYRRYDAYPQDSGVCRVSSYVCVNYVYE